MKIIHMLVVLLSAASVCSAQTDCVKLAYALKIQYTVVSTQHLQQEYERLMRLVLKHNGSIEKARSQEAGGQAKRLFDAFAGFYKKFGKSKEYLDIEKRLSQDERATLTREELLFVTQTGFDADAYKLLKHCLSAPTDVSGVSVHVFGEATESGGAIWPVLEVSYRKLPTEPEGTTAKLEEILLSPPEDLVWLENKQPRLPLVLKDGDRVFFQLRRSLTNQRSPECTVSFDFAQRKCPTVTMDRIEPPPPQVPPAPPAKEEISFRIDDQDFWPKSNSNSECDFGGKGPCFDWSAALVIPATGREVRLKAQVRIWQCHPDRGRVSAGDCAGEFTLGGPEGVVVYTAPAGWKVVELLTDTRGNGSFDVTGRRRDKIDELPGNGCVEKVFALLDTKDMDLPSIPSDKSLKGRVFQTMKFRETRAIIQREGP